MEHLERHKEANAGAQRWPLLAPRCAPAFLATDTRHFGVNKGKCVRSFFFFFFKFPWEKFLWGDDTSLFSSPDPVWVSESRPLPCFCHQFPGFILPINHPGELYRPTKAFKVNGETNHVKSAVKPTSLPPQRPSAPAPPGSDEAAHFLPSQLALDLGQGTRRGAGDGVLGMTFPALGHGAHTRPCPRQHRQ